MGGTIRIGVDVGGTFTDFALSLPDGIRTLKLPTTSDAPERAILDGIARLLARNGLAPGDIGGIVHGTTLATNAIIARQGARTALITTEGFRDVLAMGDEGRFDQYDILIRKPEPLIPRWWRFGIPERIAADGEVLLALDEAALAALAPRLRDDGIDSIAIGFLHAHANPRHEDRAAEVLSRLLPGVSISLSSRVSPEIGEYQRFSTTAANAYVQPLIAAYLDRLESGLAAMGIGAPVFMFLSNGGLCHLDTARAFPIRLVESGPAGGAVFAASLARDLAESEILAFDMGGTTAKICLIEDGIPRRSPSFEMAREHLFRQGSGLPARVPVIDLVEIGAGGGSIARVDGLRRLHVGPQSAGAVPGPACYARGGRAPAVTDANLILGCLAPGDFVGSGLTVDPALAEAALVAGVGAQLGLDAAGAAAAVIEVVDEQMAAAAREHAREKGVDLRNRLMIAFGGGGGIHGARIARRLGIDRILVPAGAGIGSAIGFLQARAVFELGRTVAMPLDRFDPDLLNALFAEMGVEAEALVARAAPLAAQETRRTLSLRYRGQGQTLSLPLDDAPLVAADGARLAEAFRAQYRQLYTLALDRIPVEIVGLALRQAEIGTDRLNQTPLDRLQRDLSGQAWLHDHDTGCDIAATLTHRDALVPGRALSGPALIKDHGTTILVPAGHEASLIAGGHVLISRNTRE